MNQLQVTFMQRSITVTERVEIVQAIPDRRYRCLVTLIRSDRPRYWNFNCHNCGSKVVELMNLEVLAIDDFYDSQNTDNAGVGRQCKGQQDNGQACPYTYFFVVR
jgi:hypothetical protein